jgi:hypothetical protein
LAGRNVSAWCQRFGKGKEKDGRNYIAASGKCCSGVTFEEKAEISARMITTNCSA